MYILRHRARLALFIAGAVVVAGLFTLTGCRGGSEKPVTIRFWNGFTGPDGRTMLALVRRFNAENPDVRVTMQRMDWNTYYNKLFVAGLGGRAPEVYILQTDAFTRFLRSSFLRPMNDLIEGEFPLDMEDFDRHVIDTVTHEGNYYAVPLDAYLMGMFYNRDLFRQAGIVDANGDPDPPTNLPEFMEALRKLKGADDEGSLDTWGFVFTFFRYNLSALISQFDGKLFSDDGTVSLINSPQNIAALEFAADLIHKHKLVPAPEAIDSWIGFRQGRVGMVFEGIFMLPDLQRQENLDFGAAPLPTLGPTPATWMGSHNLCMRADLDERQTDAAWRFIRFLSNHSLDWAEGGQVPVRKSLRETERFQNMYAQREFARQLERGVYLPSTPFVFEYFTEFDLAVERALRGRMSPKEALDRAAANVEAIMLRYGIGQEKEGDL